MYQVGDKIVYPMHGAGIVKKIEELEIFDTDQKYYLLDIVSEGMEILIPVDKTDEIGVRGIVKPEEIDEMIQSLSGDMGKMNTNWSKRYQDNMEILKSGDLMEVAGVVKNLILLDRTKGLSTGEKKMMSSARNFLVSEMVLVKDISKEEALKVIDDAVGSEAE
ncbi:MAG: CarD family transcriptional regulator [Eubacteriaceae bacterium]|jgi:CarD family transcriptional regulator